MGSDVFHRGGSSVGVVTVSRKALYKCTKLLYTGYLPFIGVLFAEFKPLYFRLYSTMEECLIASVRDGVAALVQFAMSASQALSDGLTRAGSAVGGSGGLA